MNPESSGCLGGSILISRIGDVKANTESEICIFCHTPHNSLPSSPLWNKDDPGYTYTLYHSSTVQAVPGQPDSASILCLSCHDGTTAIVPPVTLENGRMQCTSCHDPHRNLTNDFLVVTGQYSELCFGCHNRDFWAFSTHSKSTATWNGNGADSWLESGA